MSATDETVEALGRMVTIVQAAVKLNLRKDGSPILPMTWIGTTARQNGWPSPTSEDPKHLRRMA